jgi:hypothetical protein
MTTLMEHDIELEERLRPGTKVEVRKRFDASWARGFEVADAVEDGYVIRRLSDGHVLPTPFALDDVRRERKKGMWWY